MFSKMSNYLYFMFVPNIPDAWGAPNDSWVKWALGVLLQSAILLNKKKISYLHPVISHPIHIYIKSIQTHEHHSVAANHIFYFKSWNI